MSRNFRRKVTYQKISFDLGTCQNAQDYLVLIDEIINSLFATALVNVQNGQYVEYEIDTGQTKQKVKYNTPKEVTEAIEYYRRLRKNYENDIKPRVVIGVSPNATRRRY